MSDSNEISNSFIENFPGFLSIRDEKHKIIFMNENFKNWCNSLINLNPIGMTNHDIIEYLGKNKIADTFKQCHDATLEFMENNEKTNKIISFYDVNSKQKIYLDVIKFKSVINSTSYIYTVAIDITSSYRQMILFKEKSRQDTLTNAYNRSVLDDLSFNEKNYFIYIDLDNFKEVNDTFGHLCGDKVLCETVNIFRTSIRAKDVIIRMGGDEFLLILDSISNERIFAILDKIKYLFNLHFIHDYPSLSFSYGISQYAGTIDKTLDIIDKDMYKNKKHKSLY